MERPPDYIPWRWFGGDYIGIQWTGCNIEEMRSMLKEAGVKTVTCDKHRDKLHVSTEQGTVDVLWPGDWFVYDKYRHNCVGIYRQGIS